MAGSREDILAALRAASPPDPGLPDAGDRITPQRWPDLPGKLAEAVALVGGALVRVPDQPALASALAALVSSLGARRVVSAVPAAGPGTVQLAGGADPHEVAGADLAILPGAFAVAETGAVWLEAGRLAHPAAFVACEHLALVVPAGEVVNDMHAAYARLRFEGPGFGVFVAGPSKTADIEQALVLGAHGACSCTVLLVG